MRSQKFEFQAYAGDGYGAIASNPEITFVDCVDRGSALGRAGRLAKRIKGPVDVAYAGRQAWNDRYITTASPSEYNTTGYRFERLDS